MTMTEEQYNRIKTAALEIQAMGDIKIVRDTYGSVDYDPFHKKWTCDGEACPISAFIFASNPHPLEWIDDFDSAAGSLLGVDTKVITSFIAGFDRVEQRSHHDKVAYDFGQLLSQELFGG